MSRPPPFLDATIARVEASLVAYARHLPTMALTTSDPGWNSWWTVFFWGWFLGFAPMMSVFVARISRGRTIRELVLAVAARRLWAHERSTHAVEAADKRID